MSYAYEAPPDGYDGYVPDNLNRQLTQAETWEARKLVDLAFQLDGSGDLKAAEEAERQRCEDLRNKAVEDLNERRPRKRAMRKILVPGDDRWVRTCDLYQHIVRADLPRDLRCALLERACATVGRKRKGGKRGREVDYQSRTELARRWGVRLDKVDQIRERLEDLALVEVSRGDGRGNMNGWRVRQGEILRLGQRPDAALERVHRLKGLPRSAHDIKVKTQSYERVGRAGLDPVATAIVLAVLDATIGRGLQWRKLHVEEIAELAQVSKDTIERYVPDLTGWIGKETRGGRGAGRTTWTISWLSETCANRQINGRNERLVPPLKSRNERLDESACIHSKTNHQVHSPSPPSQARGSGFNNGQERDSGRSTRPAPAGNPSRMPSPSAPEAPQGHSLLDRDVGSRRRRKAALDRLQDMYGEEWSPHERRVVEGLAERLERCGTEWQAIEQLFACFSRDWGRFCREKYKYRTRYPVPVRPSFWWLLCDRTQSRMDVAVDYFLARAEKRVREGNPYLPRSADPLTSEQESLMRWEEKVQESRTRLAQRHHRDRERDYEPSRGDRCRDWNDDDEED